MLARLRPAFATLLVACLLGCNAPSDSGEVALEDFARVVTEARCEAHFACNCNAFTDLPWNEENCQELGEQGLSELADELLAAGLNYDPTCPATFVAKLEELSCSNDWSRANQDCAACRSFYGDVGEGDPCEWLPENTGAHFSNCSRGLACEFDAEGTKRCTDPCKNRVAYLEEGEACDGPEADQCLLDLACGGGGVCEIAPEVGELCPDLRCNAAYCDVDAPGGATCVELLEFGSSCEESRECEKRSCINLGGGAFCREPIPRVCRYYNY